MSVTIARLLFWLIPSLIGLIIVGLQAFADKAEDECAKRRH